MSAEPNQSPRFFISYKRDVQPDEPAALALYEALQQTSNVFIDQTMMVGTPWAQQIETELRQTDFLIVLLSEESVQSEMVLAEVETARRLAREQEGRNPLCSEAMRTRSLAWRSVLMARHWHPPVMIKPSDSGA